RCLSDWSSDVCSSDLAFDSRGFDAIDDYDCREWLKLNGASEASLNSAFIRALYDLAFAYVGGDPERPAIAAGSALRGAFRAFFRSEERRVGKECRAQL